MTSQPPRTTRDAALHTGLPLNTGMEPVVWPKTPQEPWLTPRKGGKPWKQKALQLTLQQCYLPLPEVNDAVAGMRKGFFFLYIGVRTQSVRMQRVHIVIQWFRPLLGNMKNTFSVTGQNT